MLDIFHNVRFDQSDEVELESLSEPLKQCLDYWKSLCSDGALPSWKQFDLMSLPSEIIPLVAVIDVKWGDKEAVSADDMVYRFWGTGHVNAKNIERTGNKLSEQSGRTAIVEKEYQKVIYEKRPVAYKKHIRVNKPLDAITQVTVRLPLSDDGQKINHVVSASEWHDIVP